MYKKKGRKYSVIAIFCFVYKRVDDNNTRIIINIIVEYTGELLLRDLTGKCVITMSKVILKTK